MSAGAASPERRSFIGDLRTVVASSGFRRLLTTRLISQTGDGAFTAAIGAYVFFSAATFPSPGKAAAAFAVLYLPYSLLGPFAGVFIDRWDRRQILLWSGVIRAACVMVTAAFIATGTLGLPVYAGVLAVIGVNRFFLSALSAALPHVVVADELVMANAVAPTLGTIVAFCGGFAALGVHFLAGGGHLGSAATLLAAGACYLTAGLAATRMRRASLGPDRGPGAPVLGSLPTELARVARGLAAGVAELARRRRASSALGAVAAHRFLYGILLLMSVLLYRNYFYRHTGSNAALGHYTLVVITSAAGYGAAALITPIATHRISKSAWITMLLVCGGVLTAALGAPFRQAGFLVIGFALGVTAQGIAICSTTILQTEMADDFRGRVFSINDMLFNASFVVGAAVSAAFMPIDGHSLALLLVVACGYLLAAVGYRALAGPLASGSPGTSMPASAAQRSSS